jgi:CRP-like cAMP-binding protein
MDREEQIRIKPFLTAMPIFGGLPDHTMERLLALIQVRRHPAEELICREGEPGCEMFIVGAGVVEVCKRSLAGEVEACLARLRQGDCFGEMSLIDIQPRSASVIAREATELYVVSNMDLYRLYQDDLPGYTFLVQNICRELSRRLRKADGVIADFYFRLAEYIKLATD